MGSIRVQLLFFGIAAVSGSVTKLFSYQPPFEVYGPPKETPNQKEFASFRTPHLIPNPFYYTSEARKDCDYPTEVLTSQRHPEGVFVIEEARTPTELTINAIPLPPKLEPIAIPELPVLPQLISADAPHLPAFVEETRPVIIPEAPYLPPLSLPELPVRVIVGEQAPIFVPENPALPTFGEEKASVFIPEAPVLPPFFLPKLPARISVKQIASKPGFVLCFHINGEKLEHLNPTVISDAPLLPPLALPELPARVVVEELTPIDFPFPEAPVLPPLNLSEIPVGVHFQEPENIFISEVPAPPTFFKEKQPILIPEAPVLPPFSRPELPITVTAVDSSPFWGPYPPASLVADVFGQQIFEEEKKSVIIPKAPVLPPLFVPEFPIRVTSEEPTPVFVSFTEDNGPTTIPEAPVLSPLSLAELPIKVIAASGIPELPAFINVVEPLVIPQAPELPPLVLPDIPRVVIEEPIQAPVLPPPLFFPETSQHGVIAEPTPCLSVPALSSSPIVVEAPVQILVQRSRFPPADCDTVCARTYYP